MKVNLWCSKENFWHLVSAQVILDMREVIYGGGDGLFKDHCKAKCISAEASQMHRRDLNYEGLIGSFKARIQHFEGVWSWDITNHG